MSTVAGESAPQDDLLTTREVADLARVSTVTVTRWFNEGSLIGVKVGPRTFRFRRSDVDAKLSPPVCVCDEPQVDGIGQCAVCKRKPAALLRRPAS